MIVTRREYATLKLTGRELDALNGLLSVVLNDPHWFYSTRQEEHATGRVLDKVQDLLREACR